MIGNRWFWHLSTPANGSPQILPLNARGKSRWNTAGPATDFHWYKVSKAVGSVRNQGPELVKPLSGASDVDE